MSIWKPEPQIESPLTPALSRLRGEGEVAGRAGLETGAPKTHVAKVPQKFFAIKKPGRCGRPGEI